jgi:mono/diheme cytochrome c family protein
MTLPKGPFRTPLFLLTLASILLGRPHSLAQNKMKIEKPSEVSPTAPRSTELPEARESPALTESFFQQRVVPIFDHNCFVCHGGTVQRSDLDLRSKELLLRGGSSGPAIVPGNAKESLLYQLVTHKKEPAMPMGGEKLSAEDVKAIEEWINSLSPDEALPEVDKPVTRIRAPGAEVSDKDRQFWSFVKPNRPPIPEVRDRKWVHNEIDAFILHALESQNLKPTPAAEPEVWLRRVYFDLIGLPPLPEEVQAFRADSSSEAVVKVIDRLLSSPHYGERWGRHWLDLARYADSGGFEFDIDRPNAWRYRDYVIRSFNEDKPYDRFLQEQLAGDELDPDKADALIATGFCRNGPTVDNANNEQTRMDELDDIVSTSSSVFMGLTVGCARCHDHKYDPISQRDYYQLQAVFFPSQKTDLILADDKEQAEAKARNAEIDNQIKPIKDRIAEIEKEVRERLLAEKAQRFTVLAQQAGALVGRNPADYQKELSERFAKDVKLQPEEIEARLPHDAKVLRNTLLEEVEKLNRARPRPLAAAMGITDKGGAPATTFLLKRGDYRQKGEEIQPGFPAVLSGGESFRSAPEGSRSSLRRLQLARWLIRPDHPLTARVAVNRLWQYHFGAGLVKTASDFGFNGDRPSHPELLDWLATEFVSRGWSLKSMHRLIMTSNTYCQSSRWNPAAAKADPENRLLWRVSPRRLEAEVIRDALLAVSGQLNREMGGPGVYPRIDPAVIGTGSTNKWPVDAREGPTTWRRSIYIFQKRSVVLPLLEVFDCPDSTVSSSARPTSTIAPQALALLNNEFVLEQARFFAQRVLDESGLSPRDQVRRAYQLALGRSPSTRELRWSIEFLARQTEGHALSGRSKNTESGWSLMNVKKPNPESFLALADFCHVLFNMNEFLYVD